MTVNESRNGDWICTFSGIRFWPLDPRPDEILVEDIAHALALQCRFTGHTTTFYSVAEHSLRVGEQVYKTMAPGRERIMAVLWSLLHDASEAYLCDVARPVKKSSEMYGYREAEKRIENAIADRFKLPREMPAIVKHFDEILLVTEARSLMTGFDERWSHWEMRDQALPERIVPWRWELAKETYMHNLLKTAEAWDKGATAS